MQARHDETAAKGETTKADEQLRKRAVARAQVEMLRILAGAIVQRLKGPYRPG